MQKNTIDFIKNFMNFTNYKQVLRSVKDELPKLLGFQYASIYLMDSQG